MKNRDKSLENFIKECGMSDKYIGSFMEMLGYRTQTPKPKRKKGVLSWFKLY